jgi:hypothetical protein
MVNAYEIITSVGVNSVRGRRLRALLGIDDSVELWIDSGGYRFLKSGELPKLDKIVEVYKKVEADYYVSLDFPPSPKDGPRERMLKITRTVNTFLKMKDMLRSLAEEGRLVPVVHMASGYSLRLQVRLYEPYTNVVAAGGLIPYFMQRSGRYSRLKAVAFLALVRKLWRGKLHALGLASPAVIPLLRIIGVDSGDTSSWRHKAAYGKIIIPGVGERHVSGQPVSFGPSTLRPDEARILENLVAHAERELGARLAALRESFESRALFNAWILRYVSLNGVGYAGTSAAFANLYRAAQKLMRLEPEDIDELLARMMLPSPRIQGRQDHVVETVQAELQTLHHGGMSETEDVAVR